MMQFWGVEVKNGSTMKVQPGEDKLVHLSQACLGEVKKDKENEFVRLYVQKSGQKFVIGILSLEKFPHLNLDLVFEDDFELSHDWKHGSVHFAGYKADNLDSMHDEDESDDDLEELVPVDALDNGRSERKESKASGDKVSAGVKSENAESKPKVKIVEPTKAAKKSKEDDETEDEDEDESDEDEEEEEDEEMADDSGSEGDDSDEEESDEETPKKPEPSKKRPVESALTPAVPDKKAKFATPQKKADGKKVSGHVATPHPAKHAGKTPGNAEKSNKQMPKSGGSFACSSCSRTFASEQAVQSHSKAKHGAK